MFARFFKDESGATAIEYGLIAAATGLALVAVMPAIDHQPPRSTLGCCWNCRHGWPVHNPASYIAGKKSHCQRLSL